MKMDSVISKLDEFITDQATKRMLQNVVDRKRKFDTLKKKHFWTTMVALLLGFFLIVYVYYYYIVPYSYSFFDMLMSFVKETRSFLYCAAALGTYGYMLVLKRKMDKAEKEYHALRCEIVDRSKDLWKQENAWKARHHIFDIMKKEYDINLYHENK